MLVKESYKLIFYISSAAIKIKKFIEVIRNFTRFILDLKVIYKAIKKIKWLKGLIKGKETVISHTKKYFKVLKEKPSKTHKVLNISSISKKLLEKNLIKFTSKVFPLILFILSTIPVKKLNLTTLEITSESSLNSSESPISSSKSSSLNIIAIRGKMIMQP